MFSAPTITERGNSIQVTYGNDNGLYPVFSMQAVKDEEASIREGRDIYRDVEWIDIHIVGDNLTKPSRPVTNEDRQRFAQAYQAFKNQSIVAHEGTPITEWPPVSKSLAMMLKSLNIHTVEQLAAVADGNLKWMGARELQQKAIVWLEQAKSGAGVGKLIAENEALKTQMQALQNQMAALISGEGKKRGRPAKGEVDEQDAS